MDYMNRIFRHYLIVLWWSSYRWYLGVFQDFGGTWGAFEGCVANPQGQHTVCQVVQVWVLARGGELPRAHYIHGRDNSRFFQGRGGDELGEFQVSVWD